MATKNNTINTRILLKYDSYTNWSTVNPVLLAGEVAIATIESGNTEKVNSVGLPQVLIKVGDGTNHYNTLPFVSGLAADVYSWAKAEKKPTYSASEIGGLSDYIGAHGDTNTQYQVIAAKNENGESIPYSYQLQSRNYANGAWGEWADVTGGLIDLSDIDTRLDAVEADVAQLEQDLAAEITNRGTAISTAINALDATVKHEKGADGLAIEISQVDGKLTGVTASIAAETYDAYGSAAAVDKKLTDYKTTNDAAVQANAAAIEAEAKTRKEAIEALDYEYAGTPAAAAEGTSIAYVSSVSQVDGKIAVEKTNLQFNTAYNAETNKIATMADVKTEVADLAGAMHFEGVVDALPEDVTGYANGDVIIVSSTKQEYIFSNGAFVELGNEDLGIQAVNNLDVDDVTVGADSTLTVIGQTDGKIHTSATKIQIAIDQVTGLNDAINNGGTKDSDQDKAIKANEDAIKLVNGNDTGKSMREVATDVANAAIETLDIEDAEVEGKYVSAVSQANGKITVSRKDIPVLSHTDSTASAAETEVITVVTDINAEGHTISDTRVNNVVTKVGLDKAIQALDSSVSVTTSSDNKHYVLTGVTEVDGVLTSHSEIAVSDLALSGDIKDMKQTADTYVVFNCGSATEVM